MSAAASEPESPPLQGGCLCGDVRYRLLRRTGEAPLCHCINCRRWSGAPLLAWVTVPRDALEWTRNAPVAYDHASDLATQVRRTFCARCGSGLTWERIDGDEVDVTVGTLDDAEAVAPTHHCFAGRQLSWLELTDTLPRYDKSTPRA